MFASWRVAVLLSAQNLSGPAFASFMAQASGAEAAVNRIHKGLGGVGIAAAAGMAAAGVAITAFVAHGMSEAGKLQMALAQLQIASGANPTEMKTLQTTALAISGRTSQDVETIAQELATAARSGWTKGMLLDQRKYNGQTLAQELGAFADVQMRTHHIDPTTAVKYAVQASHLLKAYDVTNTSRMLESLNRLSFTNPEELSKVVTQMGYFAPQAKQLGLSNDQIMGVLSMMGVTGGLRGKGGTGMQNLLLGAINSAQMTSSRQSKQVHGLLGLGLLDEHGNNRFVRGNAWADKFGNIHGKGTVDWDAFMKQLETTAKNTDPVTYARLLQEAFGKQGARFALVNTTPEAVAQYHRIQTKMRDLDSIQTMQQKLLGTFDNTVSLVKTNLSSLIKVAFLPLIQVAQPYLMNFANAVQDVTIWVSKNPGAALKTTLALAASGIALMVGGAALAIRELLLFRASILAVGQAALAAAGENGAAAAANDVSAVASVAGRGRAGVIGKVLNAVLGLDLLRSMGGGIAGLVRKPWTKLVGEGFEREGGGWTANSRGLLGMRGKGIGRLIGEALEGAGRFIRPLFTRMFAFLPELVERIGVGGFLRLAGMGLRFVPIVGWIVTAIQLAILAIGQFKAHATDIGWILGTIWRWMRTSLWPGIIKGVMDGLTMLKNVIVGFFEQIAKFVSNPGAWFQTAGGSIADAWTKFTAGFSAGDSGMNRGQAQTYANWRLQHSANAPLVPMNAPKGDLNLTFHIANPDPKATARQVVKHVTDAAGFVGRAQGGNSSFPGLPGSDLFAPGAAK